MDNNNLETDLNDLVMRISSPSININMYNSFGNSICGYDSDSKKLR